MNNKFQKRQKKFSILFCLLLLSASFVFSQTTDKSKNKPSKTEAELMQLEREIGDANIRRDKAFFELTEADEFIFTDSGGGITMKAEDVASLDKPVGEFKLISYVADDMKVLDYGKTAVVTGRATTTLKSKDREVINKNRFTDVFVKRNGRWQIVAGHSSRIREPQK
ncbi:MAG: nuclear transport factor 2 family protein [Pyrinomonadaceae bacterium]